MKASRLSNSKPGIVLLCLLFALILKTQGQQPPDGRININTASAEELMQLPGIGPGYAARIIAHRQKHGAFKRPQDIVIVRGFSAKRYRQIAHLIRT
ncbi:MAG: ComEA family DNA-binding protein [Blastocatellia bacterium]